MIGILVWCAECRLHHWYTFKTPILPSVDDGYEGESYWLPPWGRNPLAESQGEFNPEWN